MPQLIFDRKQLLYLPGRFAADQELCREMSTFQQLASVGMKNLVVGDELTEQMKYTHFYTRVWIMCHGGVRSDLIANTDGSETYSAAQIAEELHKNGLRNTLNEILVWSCYGGKANGFASQLRAELANRHRGWDYSDIAVLGFAGITGSIVRGGGITYIKTGGLGFISNLTTERANSMALMNEEELARYPPVHRSLRSSFG